MPNGADFVLRRDDELCAHDGESRIGFFDASESDGRTRHARRGRLHSRYRRSSGGLRGEHQRTDQRPLQGAPWRVLPGGSVAICDLVCTLNGQEITLRPLLLEVRRMRPRCGDCGACERREDGHKCTVNIKWFHAREGGHECLEAALQERVQRHSARWPW